MECAVELKSGVRDVINVAVGVLEGGVELGGGVEELAAAVEEGGGGMIAVICGGVEELAAAELEPALGALPPLSPSLYGGRRGKAAKENVLMLAFSQHAVPPDNSGRLVSQQ